MAADRLLGPRFRADQRALRYAMALLVILTIGVIRFALTPIIGSQSPLLPFLLGVFLAAYLGGRGPGLLASVLVPLMVTPVFTAWPHGTQAVAWTAHSIFFVVIGILVSVMVDRLQRTAQAQRDALLTAQYAETEARASAAQFRLISDALPVLIAYIDKERHYRFNNRAYEEWFGAPPESLLGKQARTVLGEDAYASVRPHMDQALAGEPTRFEAQIPYRDASMRYVDAHYIPDHGADGEVRGFFVLVEDVTERKRSEEALRAAERRKDEFLAMLAHELRNPLAPIRNVAYVLSRGKLDHRALAQNAEILTRQVNQLAHLVNELLDVARVTRGLIEIKKSPVSLDAVIDTALESVQPLITVKHQHVNLMRSAAPLTVDADPVRLSQVFANLLSNAAKYSPDRAVIEVSIEQVETHAVVTVRDSGAGIDAQVLPHVFELFVQADRSLDRAQGGLGVGLTLVKALVEMHGGTVNADSAGLGQGSEFKVRLPVLNVSVDSSLAATANEAARSTSHSILVVDDNVDAAESLATLLRMAGYDVRTAPDGQSALALLEQFPAEAILLDIGLPGGDGYVIAQAIRERFPGIPRRLYALTGYGREEDRELAVSAGFDVHLTKPVDPEQLLKRLSEELTDAYQKNS
jgi:PAS domain S-box-containing protein